MNGQLSDQFVAIAGAAPCATDAHSAVLSPSFVHRIVADRASSPGYRAPAASAEQAPATGTVAITDHTQHAYGQQHRSWRACDLSGKAKTAPAAIAPVGALRIAKTGIDAMVRARQRFPVFCRTP
jgi:hypothetical protein